MGSLGQFLVGGAFTGLVVAVLQFFLTRPKVRAESAKIATETTSEIIKNLRDDIVDLRGKNATLEAKVDQLERAEEKSAQKVRDVTGALWECVQYIRRASSVMTDEQRKTVGGAPDVDRFFR